MRFFLPALIVLATSLCSCQRSSVEGVGFSSHLEWPSREQLNVEQATDLFLRSSHWDYCALWTNTPACRVFLSCGRWERWGDETWTVLVLDSRGQVLDYNYTHAKAHRVPRRLISISPLRFGFGPTNTGRILETVEVKYPADDWRVRLTRNEKVIREMQERREKAHRN